MLPAGEAQMYGIFGLPHYVSSLVYFRECPKGEVRRIPILGTSVYRAAQAQWGCPDSRMTALFFLSFRAGSGCNHSETWAGCIVSLTTPTKSSLSAFRSVSSRSFIENASSVLAASYLVRKKLRSMNDWIRCLKGLNKAAIARVAAIVASVDSWPKTARKGTWNTRLPIPWSAIMVAM